MIRLDRRSFGRRLLVLLGMVGLFMGGIALSAAIDVEMAVTRSASAPDSVYLPSFQRVNGPQLEMVYVGSAACGWSNQAPLPEAVETIKIRLASYAAANGMSFRAVGIALDWSPQVGMEHLAKFGNFDEVSAGYSWGNSLALRYLWAESSARHSTPQVLVYRRNVIAPADTADALHYAENRRERLLVKSGLQTITDWADTGVALPEMEGGAVRDR